MNNERLHPTTDGRMITKEQWNKEIKELVDSMPVEFPYEKISPEEEAYRRGYSQGFAFAINRECTQKDIQKVYAWRNNPAPMGPPFSPNEYKFF